MTTGLFQTNINKIMYRLKQLDENQHPGSIMNPERSVEPSQLLPADKFIDGTPSDFLKAQTNRFTHLVTAAAVFHDDRLLLVQRSETDSYPGHWEIPGGTADPTDKTIRAAIARELHEETGLTLKNIVQQILPAETFTTGWGKRTKKWLKVSFMVDITDEARVEADEEVKLQETKEKIGERVAVETKKLEELMSDAEKALVNELGCAIKERTDNPAVYEIGVPVIKLNPKEHQHHLWVTEEEVSKREIQGMELKFIRDEQVQTMLGAFKLHGERKAELAD